MPTSPKALLIGGCTNLHDEGCWPRTRRQPCTAFASAFCVPCICFCAEPQTFALQTLVREREALQ